MDEEKMRNPARRRTLEVFFNPKSVAVIGATEAPHSVGRSIVANLKDAPFPGAIYPVNPRHDTILGLRCYRSIESVAQPVDLAVIATPANTVPGVIRECAGAGVPAAIIISAGFREIGERGAALEARDPGGCAPRRNANRRAELPRADEPASPAQCDLREQYGTAGPSRLHQPERRSLYGDP